MIIKEAKDRRDNYLFATIIKQIDKQTMQKEASPVSNTSQIDKDLRLAETTARLSILTTPEASSKK